MKIADVYNHNNGKKKVEFFETGVYEIIKELGYRYAKVNNKTYFLKESNGVYDEVSLHDIEFAFYNYIKDNFDLLVINGEIERYDFLEEYHRKKVVKNNDIRRYLFEDFESYGSKKHFLLLKVDDRYRNKYNREKMSEFFKSEGFIEAKDDVGNFVKGCPLFYKKINNDTYLIFSIPRFKYKWEPPYYELWKINVKSEKEFLNKENNNFIEIVKGFELEKDIDTFKLEIKNREFKK